MAPVAKPMAEELPSAEAIYHEMEKERKRSMSSWKIPLAFGLMLLLACLLSCLLAAALVYKVYHLLVEKVKTMMVNERERPLDAKTSANVLTPANVNALSHVAAACYDLRP